MSSIIAVHQLKPTPKGWHVTGQREDGLRYHCPARKLTAIVSVAAHGDGKRWKHLSVSHADRIPTWGELRDVKHLFMGDDVYAYQVLPPKDMYVNITPTVLHVFECLDGPQLPEFSGLLPDGKRTL